nr:radical SAM protein [uncultured Methanospirillum sp.]
MNIGCIYSIYTPEFHKKPISINMIPFGISYVASSLKTSGYHPYILVFTPQTNISRTLTEFIETYHPQLFCLSAVASQISLISNIAKEIKKNYPDIFILLGGVHATLNPEETISMPFFDAICIGEGEVAVCELSRQIELNSNNISGIENLWIKQPDGTIEKNEQGLFIQDLDELPFIDRNLWNNWIFDPNNPEQSILISRGCPNKCSYCSNHILAKKSKGRYVRFRSPMNILGEIKDIIRNYPHINSIWLESETLSMNLSFCYELLGLLENFNKNRQIPIKFRTNLSLNKKILNSDFFILLSHANVDSVNIGVESGSYYIRNSVLRRPNYSNEDIELFCKLSKEFNINVLFFIIIGLPEETIFHYYQTIDCIRQCSPNQVSKYLYYPYPGTDLYSLSKEKGLLSDSVSKKVGPERCTPSLNLPSFSKRRQMIEFILFEYRIYHGKLPSKTIIIYTVKNILQTIPELTKLFTCFSRIRSRL